MKQVQVRDIDVSKVAQVQVIDREAKANYELEIEERDEVSAVLRLKFPEASGRTGFYDLHFKEGGESWKAENQRLCYYFHRAALTFTFVFKDS